MGPGISGPRTSRRRPQGLLSPSRTPVTVIPSACLRYRYLSETRAAVCLIFGPVVVLWQEGAPEGSDQGKRALLLVSSGGACIVLAIRGRAWENPSSSN